MQQFSMENFIKATKPSGLNSTSINNAPILPQKTQNELQQDTFELTQNAENSSKKDEKKSLKNKIAGLVGFAGGAATIAFLIFKNKTSKLQHLPKHLDFTKAKTTQEAIEYGKKVLGIEDYSGFMDTDVDVINWFNEAMVRTSNAQKGKIRMPRKISYESMQRNVIAGVVTKKDCPTYGYFYINKDIFSNLDKQIDTKLKGYEKVKDGIMIGNVKCPLVIDEITPLIEAYKNKTATFEQKVHLFEYLMSARETCNRINNSNVYFINYMLRNNLITSADMGGITFDELLTKTNKEQHEILVKAVEKVHKKTGKTVSFGIKKATPFTSLYHEMGHIQDMELRILPTGKYKSPADYPKELQEWLADGKKMQIANCVSKYAASGPGEFVAEVYAKVLSGNKLNDDVLALYKKLNGPKLPTQAA